MRINTPVFVVLRIVIYALILFGISEAIYFDAENPMEDGYFGEITLTEMGQEFILLLLFAFYLFLGFKQREIQAVTNIVSLFYLMSFIREFNFLIDKWIYPVLVVVVILIWVIIHHFKNIKQATVKFFSLPASSWFLSGFLVTYLFSRLMGRSAFWRLLYHDETYRLAKAATEEGLELLGNSLMLIAAIEFSLYYFVQHRNTIQ